MVNILRRHVRMFKPRFAQAVREGRKLQTVRPWPKRVMDYPKVGDVIDCRMWTGKAYATPQLKLTVGVICEAEAIAVDAERGIGFLDVNEHGGPRWVWLMPDRAEAFARADGFESLAEMLAWFEEAHGLPFDGVLIKWEILNSTPPPAA